MFHVFVEVAVITRGVRATRMSVSQFDFQLWDQEKKMQGAG